MSEVKRYRFKGAAGEYIYEKDYDAALAREAALREKMETRTADLLECGKKRKALQQRLTAAEQKLAEAYEWGYGDGQNSPNGYSDEADRDKCVAELTKPAAEGECS